MRRDRQDAEFTEFVTVRSDQLYRSAYLLTTSTAAAEDLLQTTLAKVYAAWARVRAADDAAAYAHGVLLNAFLSDKRRRSSTELPQAEPGVDRVAGHEADPTDRVVLLAALRELAPVDRAVVVLRYWEDHTVAETARRLHLSEAAVKNRSLRALRRLRDLLAEPPPVTVPTTAPTTAPPTDPIGRTR